MVDNCLGSLFLMPANGPAIRGGCVTRRQHRSGSWYFSRETVTVQGGYGTCFCRHGANFIEHYECRGTNLGGGTNLSLIQIWKAVTGAVSRCKLSRSQKFVLIQNFDYVQMRVSGFNSQNKFILHAGSKAKTVTSNLPLLSVLAVVVYLLIVRCFCNLE